MKQPPKTFLCSSAVGFTETWEEELTESSSPGRQLPRDNLPQLGSSRRSSKGRRCAHRVDANRYRDQPHGRSPQNCSCQLNWCRGPAGGGRQYYSWISLDDQIYAAYHLMMTESCEGPTTSRLPNPSPETIRQNPGRVLRRPPLHPPASSSKSCSVKWPVRWFSTANGCLPNGCWRVV